VIIYVDENVPQKITFALRAAGYQVEYVTRSVEDKEILQIAFQQKALLITSDKDFERLVLDERRPTAGVILLRIAMRVSMEDRAKIIVNALKRYQDKVQGAFTILTESAIDIHRPLH
jgi:predicted nuclease of predicted toxin-antitoxin system